jgi:DNA-binding transcriptional MerR regulator/methanogenic corrinoid protein MtbC1
MVVKTSIIEKRGNTMTKESSQGQYSIQLASKISGVGIHTIRAWEKRYQAVVPQRSHNGRREYSDDDIDKLTLLSELCTLGHTIGKIAGLPRTELRVLLEKLGKKANSVTSGDELSLLKEPVNTAQSLQNLYLALECYKLDVISHEISKLKLLLNPRDFALDIISPLLTKVGMAVHEGKLNISQEHALSAILKFHIGHLLYNNQTSKSTKNARIVISAPEGDFHEFGILMGALLCRHYNVPYFYLGPNLPLESLIDAVHSLEVNTILLGSTIAPETKPIGFVNTYINSILRKLPKIKLIVGGNSHVDKTLLTGSGQFVESMADFDKYLKAL